MKTYVVYFRFTKPGEKKPGPVTHFKIQASSGHEAKTLVERQGRYPGIEIVRVEPA